ncbi:hypothetical protein HOLleu_40287 [Holothuria leucospilota]|uniref:Uncharacterized protein n=1 Tax=Holothuria leucospilota TaxID=206669 RepID=A0A9Q0YKU4_HOLLE|nr:hypothetical protein HOLleu_40287 [Holothuria leucospilota]
MASTKPSDEHFSDRRKVILEEIEFLKEECERMIPLVKDTQADNLDTTSISSDRYKELPGIRTTRRDEVFQTSQGRRHHSEPYTAAEDRDHSDSVFSYRYRDHSDSTGAPQRRAESERRQQIHTDSAGMIAAGSQDNRYQSEPCVLAEDADYYQGPIPSYRDRNHTDSTGAQDAALGKSKTLKPGPHRGRSSGIADLHPTDFHHHDPVRRVRWDRQEPPESHRDDVYQRQRPREPEHWSKARPNTLPEKFDGSQPWDSYISHFESVSEINGWRQCEKARYLKASLKGDALEILADLPNTPLDFETLSTALDTRFGHAHKGPLFRAQLTMRTRERGESVQQLA